MDFGPSRWDLDEDQEDRFWDSETGSNESGRNVDGSGANQIQGHICKYVYDEPVKAIVVNSPKVI